MEKSYKSLGYFLLLLVPLTIAGFFKTYINQFPKFNENINGFIHIHTFIATLWIVLLIVQPFLIVYKKWRLHRNLGKVSYVLFPLLILSFIPQMIKVANSDQPKNLFFPLADSTLLILFYTLAIYHKKNSSKHMRYMIAIALVFLGPTFGRIGPILLGWSSLFTQNILYLIVYAVLVSLMVYDKRNGKKYQPYVTATVCFLMHQIVYHIVFL